MSDPSETTKSILSEEERKRLITEIGNIKNILDSFKYGLNFEQFADALFKTIDRQTLAINKLEAQMREIIERMKNLEKRFDEGIRVTVSGAVSAEGGIEPTEVIIGDKAEEKAKEEPTTPPDIEVIKKEIEELKIKIAKLFEKENELTEMAMNDPAAADEYEEKARVAREMRVELEAKKKELEDKLQ